jgi:hypothetical protein
MVRRRLDRIDIFMIGSRERQRIPDSSGAGFIGG